MGFDDADAVKVATTANEAHKPLDPVARRNINTPQYTYVRFTVCLRALHQLDQEKTQTTGDPSHKCVGISTRKVYVSRPMR